MIHENGVERHEFVRLINLYVTCAGDKAHMQFPSAGTSCIGKKCLEEPACRVGSDRQARKPIGHTVPTGRTL